MSHFYYPAGSPSVSIAQMDVRESDSDVQPAGAKNMPGGIAAGRWFFTGFAVSMILVAGAGFLPSLVNTTARHAPVSLLVGAHGIVYCAWLVIFLVQARLVAARHIQTHRRLGTAAACVAALMIALGYAVCIAMVRRGFDLSGDLKAQQDPAYAVVFPLGDLLMFAVLLTAALCYRRRPEMHKRLMLFANIALIPAPLAHWIGHVPWLAALPGGIIGVPIAIFLAAAVVREFRTLKRIHRLTWAIAGSMLLSGPLRAMVIGPSPAWHAFVSWLAR